MRFPGAYVIDQCETKFIQEQAPSIDRIDGLGSGTTTYNVGSL